MDKKERIKYFYEVVVSENKLEALPEYVSENCAHKIGLKISPMGIDGMKEHLLSLKKTYPDYKIEILNQYQDGDTIISEIKMSGTHKGEFAGIHPTNKILEITGINIDKIVDGKIIEHTGTANTFETFLENALIRPV